MFREHELLNTPKDDTILWRYSDLSHFLNLLERQMLYFANRREFIDDPWEGVIPTPLTEAIKRESRSTFLSSAKSTGMTDAVLDELTPELSSEQIQEIKK